MADEAPLIFEPRLGMLSPVNPAAREAMEAIQGRVSIKVSGMRRNQRRRGLYWIVTGLVADLLNDAHDLALTDNDLHDIIRKKLRLYDEVTLPSGEVHIKLRSTSDKAMTEAERADFTTRAFDVYSKWTGVEVDVLRREAGENSC